MGMLAVSVSPSGYRTSTPAPQYYLGCNVLVAVFKISIVTFFPPLFAEPTL
jgi:hypothetical protein